MIELVIAGAAGRMGGRLVALAREAPDLRVAGAFERAGHPAIGRDAGEMAGVGTLGIAVAADPAPLLAPDRILMEFTAPEPTLAHARLAAQRGARAVVGTTGLSTRQVAELTALARETAIVFSTLGERLELTHRAHSRDTFAHGALRAARWVRTAAPGLHSMHDVLGL